MPEDAMSQPADPRDVESIDAIIAAAYDVISGPGDKKRDWNRERSLFYPGARVIPTASVPGRNDVAEPANGGQLLQAGAKSSNEVAAGSSWATQPVGTTGCPSRAQRVDLEPQILDVEGYIARAEPLLQKGFYEKEVARRTEQFGCIAHIWSTYESRHDPNDPAPFMRGINSFQLFNDGSRWWILSVYWQHESAEHAIPEKYL